MQDSVTRGFGLAWGEFGLDVRRLPSVRFGDVGFEVAQPIDEGAASVLGSLVWRPSLYARKSVTWISARSWSVQSKKADIQALKRAKGRCDDGVIQAAAAELARLAEMLLGGPPAIVTNVACGHSRRPDCFGKRLAMATATAIGAPFVCCFADRFVAGSSHPKEVRHLPPLEWAHRPAGGFDAADRRCCNFWLAYRRGPDRIAGSRRAGVGHGVDRRERERMRVAIVGSRRRTDKAAVEALVASLVTGTVVVSGGCRSVDTWAADAARARGLDVVEHRPALDGVRCAGEASRRYHARNQVVVDDANLVVAFVSPDRTGGTEDTIRRAHRAGKPVQLL